LGRLPVEAVSDLPDGSNVAIESEVYETSGYGFDTRLSAFLTPLELATDRRDEAYRSFRSAAGVAGCAG
jgi:hypothetical protein